MVSRLVDERYTFIVYIVEPRRFVKRYGSAAQADSFSRELFNVFMPPTPSIDYFLL
jgi:hypothetical protein